ncbi:hypothetical protein [Pseudoclavibacter sp. 8L]|uniref:hypothetical protein n=1 Tax=Pseudoclavibacter sp. 8L TaxID=2653162 RepID=UPI00135A49B7|nr:hypothetical protein [Pseudoclavibacter sp. 8L]
MAYPKPAKLITLGAAPDIDGVPLPAIGQQVTITSMGGDRKRVTLDVFAEGVDIQDLPPHATIHYADETEPTKVGVLGALRVTIHGILEGQDEHIEIGTGEAPIDLTVVASNADSVTVGADLKLQAADLLRDMAREIDVQLVLARTQETDHLTTADGALLWKHDGAGPAIYTELAKGMGIRREDVPAAIAQGAVTSAMLDRAITAAGRQP